MEISTSAVCQTARPAFYFTPHNDAIIQLIILRNRRDI